MSNKGEKMSKTVQELEWIQDDLVDLLIDNEPFPVFFDPFDKKSGLAEVNIYG
jgi:hypothetical protein